MSNGIASGVPPADGCAGGVAGAGVGDCASADEPTSAVAQAARLKETIDRIGVLPIEVFVSLSAAEMLVKKRKDTRINILQPREAADIPWPQFGLF
jgi:hypothetical protein